MLRNNLKLKYEVNLRFETQINVQSRPKNEKLNSRFTLKSPILTYWIEKYLQPMKTKNWKLNWILDFQLTILIFGKYVWFLIVRLGKRLQNGPWVDICKNEAHTLSASHTICIRTVLSALMNWLKLFGQSNMHRMFDFCPRPARMELNVPKLKSS